TGPFRFNRLRRFSQLTTATSNATGRPFHLACSTSAGPFPIGASNKTHGDNAPVRCTSLFGGRPRAHSQIRSGIGCTRARRHPGCYQCSHGAAAAGDAYRADCVRAVRRTGWRRLRRNRRNATGFMLFEYGIGAKWLELLRAIAPGVKRVGFLQSLGIAAGPGLFGAMQALAPSLGVEVRPINVRDAGEIERAMTALARPANGGLIVAGAAGASQCVRT